MTSPSKRRWLRYSLRSALAALTLFCIWFGYLCNRAYEQRKAVEQLKQVFASVGYDRPAKQLLAPTWLRAWLGDDFFLRVNSVQLGSPFAGESYLPLTPDRLERAVSAMHRLPDLNQLWFRRTGISDEQFARFSPLADRIAYVYFDEVDSWKLTGECVKYLKDWKHLKHLTLHSSGLKSEALVGLGDLKELETLGITNCLLEKDTFAAISQCPKLESLTLVRCGFTGDALAQLKSTPRLQRLTLQSIRPYDIRDPVADVMVKTSEKAGVTLDLPRGEPPSYIFKPVTGPGMLRSMSKKFSQKYYDDWVRRTLPRVTVNTFPGG